MGKHWSFWLIGGISLIWNLAGVFNFIAQTNATTVAEMPELHRAIIESRPSWAFIFFGVAVCSGVLGSILLLLSQKLSHHLFLLSLISVIIQAIPYFTMDTGLSFIMIFSMVMMQVLFSSFLLWYSRLCYKKGWLN